MKNDLRSVRTSYASFAALFLIIAASISAFIYMRNVPLIDAFKNGTRSPELFELPNGINEFDLLHVNGRYYLASDNKTETELRSAKSIVELAEAPSSVPVPGGNYPSILHVDGVWHLWVWLNHKGFSQHFTSSNFEGPYEAADTFPLGVADIHVRQMQNGRYFAAYKDNRHGAKRASGLLAATSPYGPWKDWGHFFVDGRETWHAEEEADPAVFEYGGKTYLTFAGWGGVDISKNQKLGIAQINPKTGKAVGKATMLLEANEPWHVRNGQHKLFNPVFLCDNGRSRLFFAQNVSTSGVPAGWGYIEANRWCRE